MGLFRQQLKNNSRRWGRFSRLYILLGCFLVLGGFMLAVTSGMTYEDAGRHSVYIPLATQASEGEQTKENAEFSGDTRTCLILTDRYKPESTDAMKQFKQIFHDMKQDYEILELTEQKLDSQVLENYETVVVTVASLDALRGGTQALFDWAEQGGRVLFSQTLEADSSFRSIYQKLGIREYGYENALVNAMKVSEDFMIGGGSFQIEDGYESALIVSLNRACRVLAKTTGRYPVPLIWELDCGKGKIVVDNFGICEKATRGFFAASYSLLEDVCLYPVIDASLFYIDDFPSPVPQGEGKYIQQTYHMNVSDFYTNVWWPDMIALAEKHGMKYTGMIIENYSNQVSGEFKTNPDVERFHFFGDMLLSKGWELGYHGYNHQPLGLDNSSYREEGYKAWPDLESMRGAVTELIRFAHDVFPNTTLDTYVPPSNILSPEGRKMLVEDFPELKNIASIYFFGQGGYEQEFEVAPDGMIEVPRIVSSCDLTAYMKLAALSELNFHYVNSHFLHPDDLLDPDRGAAQGWETLKEKFGSYLDWLYTSAPRIRSMTGSEGAGAVQRFYQISYDRADTDQGIHLKLHGFVDEASFMMRVNKGKVASVEGGTLELLTGNLYLVRANSDNLWIQCED